MEISEGKLVALRRERAGWNQDELAKAAGVSRSTVWKIEKDKNVEKQSYDAVIGALAARERVLKGPNLSTPPDTTAPSMNGGVDVPAAVQKERQRYRAYLEGIHSTAKATLDDIEQRLAILDAEESEQRRKRG